MKHQQVPDLLDSRITYDTTLVCQAIQKVRLAFPCSLFPIIAAPLQHAQEVFDSSRFVLHICLTGGGQHGARQACFHINSRACSRSPSPCQGAPCLWALPITSLLIFPARVYSLDKHKLMLFIVCSVHIITPGRQDEFDS